MVSVKSFIRTSSRSEKESNIRLRLVDGRKFQLYVKTPLTVKPALWEPKTERLKSCAVIDRKSRREFDEAVSLYKKALEEAYYEVEGKEPLTEELVLSTMESKIKPTSTAPAANSVSPVSKVTRATTVRSSRKKSKDPDEADFYLSIDRFLEDKQYPYTHAKTYITLNNAFKRFEFYKQIYTDKNYKITLSGIDENFLIEFCDFIFNEYKLAGNKRYEKIYEEDQKHNYKILVRRGNNTMARYFKRVSTLWKWFMKRKLVHHDPFEDFTIDSTHDGTPYYITTQERDKIYNTDLAAVWNRMDDEERHKACPAGYSCVTICRLIQMRDIFVFQCMVGCRVGDLVNFTPANIVSVSTMPYCV